MKLTLFNTLLINHTVTRPADLLAMLNTVVKPYESKLGKKKQQGKDILYLYVKNPKTALTHQLRVGIKPIDTNAFNETSRPVNQQLSLTLTSVSNASWSPRGRLDELIFYRSVIEQISCQFDYVENIDTEKIYKKGHVIKTSLNL